MIPIQPEPLPPPQPKRKRGAAGALATWIVIAILLIGTAANGALLWQDRSDLADTESGVSALQTQNAALESSITQAQAESDTLQANLAALQQTVLQLSTSVPRQTAGTDFTAAAKKIEPSAVYIEAASRFTGGTGSGTIIRSNGYVLTNEHVISGATSISVTLKTGEKFSASIVAADAHLDAAVLKLNTTRTDLPAATIGSSASVVVGQEIITCGFPLGKDLFGTAAFGPASFNHGIVSAIRSLGSIADELNRINPTITLNYIQIDADINPGNSGGGLFNLAGELIGIPSYGEATGINEAIPIDAVKALIQSAVGG